MHRFLAPLIFLSAIGLAGISHADQVPVNIAYPHDGLVYEISPNYPLIPVSFSVTCPDFSDHSVEWGMESRRTGRDTLGRARFYGQITMQFLLETVETEWNVWVDSDCGNNDVTFEVVGP